MAYACSSQAAVQSEKACRESIGSNSSLGVWIMCCFKVRAARVKVGGGYKPNALLAQPIEQAGSQSNVVLYVQGWSPELNGRVLWHDARRAEGQPQSQSPICLAIIVPFTVDVDTCRNQRKGTLVAS